MMYSPVLTFFVALMACAVAKQDPCECLNWKKLYGPLPQISGHSPSDDTEWPRLVCGESLELAPWAAIPQTMYEAVNVMMDYGCVNFYSKMDNNYCTNTHMAEYGTKGFDGASWCIVSNECKDLNGGNVISDKTTWSFGPSIPGVTQKLMQFAWYRDTWNMFHTPKAIPRDVSWKLCTPGKDKSLRDFDPEELYKLAKNIDAGAGFLFKKAYHRLMPSAQANVDGSPNFNPTGKEWADIEPFVRSGDVNRMPKVLQDAINASVPIIVDVQADNNGGQRCIHGKKVYELENFHTMTNFLNEGIAVWPFKRGRDVGEL